MFRKLLPILLLCTGVFALASNLFTQKSVECHPAVKSDGPSRMYRSADKGHTWSPIGEGLPADLNVTSLDTLGKRIVLASSNHGVYLSDPQKQSWQQLNTFVVPSPNISSLHVANGVIYIGVEGKYIYASNDVGLTWTWINHDLHNEWIMPILRTGTELLVGTDNGIFALKDGTKTWRKVLKGRVTSLLNVGNSVVARTPWGLHLSSDHGDTWSEFGTDRRPGDLLVIDGKIIARSGYLWEMFDDAAKTWQPIEAGTSPDNGMYDMVKVGDAWVCCQQHGIFQSKDVDGPWNAVYQFPTVEPLFQIMPEWKTQSDVLSEPFIDLIVVDNVIYGGFGRREGC